MATDKSTRETRENESHEFAAHDAKVRQFLQMTYPDPLSVDESKIPEGFEYRWVRDSVWGQRDPYRMVYMARKGYTPVPADRHPELSWGGLPWQEESPHHGYICQKGLVLCERLKKYAELEQRTLESQHAARVASLPGQEHFMDEPTMPIRVIANSTTWNNQRNSAPEAHAFA